MGFLVFRYRDRIFNLQVQSYGAFSFGAYKKNSMVIPELSDINVTMSFGNGTYNLNIDGAFICRKSGIPFGVTLSLVPDGTITVYYIPSMHTSSRTFKLPYNGCIKLGKNFDNAIVLVNPCVSRYHLVFRCENGAVHVEDNNSTNGTFVNGKRITKALIHSGDYISIMHMRIRLVDNVLYFDNVGNEMKLNPVSEEASFGGQSSSIKGGAIQTEKGFIRYRRSPRTQESLPYEAITLAPPPANPGNFEARKKNFAGMVGTGAMLAANLLAGSASPALLAASAAGFANPLIHVLSGRGDKERKRKFEEYAALRAEKYGYYIGEQKAKIKAVADSQRRVITRENPSAKELLIKLEQLDRTIWERSASDKDFGDIRLGMGYEKLCVQVKRREDNSIMMESDEQQELANQIVEETRYVDQIPARLCLSKYQMIGMVGDRNRSVGLIRNMLISMAYLHSYTDLKIIGIFDEEEKGRWGALRWLPHTWDDNKQFRYISFNGDDAQDVVSVTSNILKERLEESSGNSFDEKKPSPYYVFILGSRKYTENSELVRLLSMNNGKIGASAIFMYDQMFYLPHSCEFIVDVDGEPNAYVRTEINNKFFFTPDEIVSREELDKFCRKMSAIKLDGVGGAGSLPENISFLEGYGARTPNELNVWSRWTNSKPYKSLSAPIGIGEGGAPFMFDIHEKAHGPHGLIAGTTGSGKSETVISWILSMCVNYHPYDVNFVIIDYKGGSMADSLMPLPHVVGKITNIESGVLRTLDSLNAELKRRQVLFASCKEKYGLEIKDILQYQEYYHNGMVNEPIPQLIIVADEFAELKKSQPEFMKNLVSAARIGRSLGVHLVLATQKPTGVVDEQINSNSKFRICLKVATSADSREMIKTPDAAKISHAGRAYMLVGESDMLAQFQSYYSGGEYSEDKKGGEPESKASLVRVTGQRVSRAKNTEKKDESSTNQTELSAIREYIIDQAQAHGIVKINGPWLEELPEQISLPDIDNGYEYTDGKWQNGALWLKIPVGLFDKPDKQQQGIQFIDFAKDGHLAIYGAPGTGKTNLLKAIILSAARQFSPDTINFYLMDFGGWSLNTLSALPHVGGVALDCEEEKMAKLAEMLSLEITRRKRVFMSEGVGSIDAYREAVGGGMPAIILAIDNIVPIFEMYPDWEQLLITISGQGPAYGIYLMYTANNTTGIRFKIVQNIKNAVSFEMTDKSDYLTIVGRADHTMLAGRMGRAFIKDNPPVLFQSALFWDGDTQKDRVTNSKALINEMNAAWKGYRPDSIPVMPETVSFSEIFDRYNDDKVIPVGVDFSKVQAASLDMTENYNMLITGSMSCGKSRLLGGLIGQLAEKNSDNRIYIFDSEKEALKAYGAKYGNYSLSANDEKVTELLKGIESELNIRQTAINQTKKREDFSPEMLEHLWSGKICIFVDDLKEFVMAISDGNAKLFERISKMARALDVLIFCAGRFADIDKLNQQEQITRGIVANQRCVAIGGKPANYLFLKNSLGYKEKEQDAGEGNGFLYNDGECIKIKLPV